jgi:hypothetical protein
VESGIKYAAHGYDERFFLVSRWFFSRGRLIELDLIKAIGRPAPTEVAPIKGVLW